MKKLSLSGKWRMTGNGFDCIGTVPGSLFSFLLENKLMDDPFYRDNEYKALELTYHDYTFERSFELSLSARARASCSESFSPAISVYSKERRRPVVLK